MNKKRTLWRICRAQPTNDTARQRYRATQLNCRRLLHKYELDAERRVIDSGNNGAFYKYVNKKLSRPSGVGSLIDDKDALITDDVHKADLLNNYFSSVCTKDDGNLPNFISRTSSTIETISFTPAIITRCINKLKTNTSAGPDGLPTIILKKLGDSIAYPLSMFFTSFMSVSKLPTEWKSAIVTPIYKKGQSSCCNNYRPISLTCTSCKIMERTIVLELTGYLRANNLITREQHGFLTRRSTTTNLLETLNDWTVAINGRHLVSTVYIDYSKAFDAVCHTKLIHKLRAYGICGNLLDFIEFFLMDRCQRTRVGYSLSGVTYLTSGVVQGSCLGPLLFLLYINDIVNVFDDNVVCKLYADDVKLYCYIDSNADTETLQHNIDALRIWSDTWQLNISIAKCAALTLGNRSITLDPYRLYNSDIVNVCNTRDLGISIDSHLKFTLHINQLCGNARRKIGLLFKCFTTRNPLILTKAYTTYVRPILEYASVIWNPVYVGQIYQIESVQRHFTKRIMPTDISYSDRLSQLKLESLELRRLKTDLIMLYKIIKGLVDLDFKQFLVLNLNTFNTRGHAFRIAPECATVNCRRHFFTQRVTNIWNSLPADIVNFENLNAFKVSLVNVDFSNFVSF